MKINPSQLVTIIEEKVSKIHTTHLDVSFNEILDMYQSNELNISPDFQRLFRWSNGKQSRFIESLILEMPVPPIYVIELEDGKYELIDGLQRISSYLHLRGELVGATHNNIEDKDKLKLSDCDVIEELNGFTFDELPTSYQIRLKRSFIRMEVIRKESNKLIRYHMFKRLNTGGEGLEDQELRNCTIRILNESFPNFLNEVVENQDFQDTTCNISEAKTINAYKQELILRFLAFKNFRENYTHDIADFLDEYMERVSLPDSDIHFIEFDYNIEKAIFAKTFKILNKTLGSKVFGQASKNFDSIHENFSIYQYESISLALQKIINVVDCENPDHLAKISEKLISIKLNKDFKPITTGGGKNTKNKLNERIDFVSSRLLEINFD
ncbi:MULTISPECIES: DUF262 domain-containing protein [Acinetobacter]|uniref:DUF262 domain-containing protein n=1 Tax=Acinetobacter TaxID=469 RepID=UPI0021CDB774|nr:MULTISPECIES: DUF262 domain-containing protein [Acinetobacter]MCU4563870.1 DUF262 domain-containing protein [Acinetobacter sp. WU_MDCI_Abxc222]MEB6669878.1 DUF262 domain-containing protein [Acinetobacter pittii]